MCNLFCFSWHISHFRHTPILNQCALLTLMVVKSTARWISASGSRIHRINFQPERQLCPLYVVPTKLSGPLFQAISMPGHNILQLVIFQKISTGNINCAAGFSSDWSHVPRKVPKTLVKHGIMWLELCCLNLGIWTSLALAWNGFLQMDSNNNVTLCWLPGSGIILNKSGLLKSHMAHARGVIFRMVST